MTKLITLPAIDHNHFRNLMFAARRALPTLAAKEIQDVGGSLAELESALSLGTVSEPAPKEEHA